MLTVSLAAQVRAAAKRLNRIKTLKMFVVHGNFTDGGSRAVHFPPPRKPKSDDPKTILDCFNLWGYGYHRVTISIVRDANLARSRYHMGPDLGTNLPSRTVGEVHDGS